MTRIKFQQNLDGLKERLLIMAGMAELSPAQLAHQGCAVSAELDEAVPAGPRLGL